MTISIYLGDERDSDADKSGLSDLVPTAKGVPKWLLNFSLPETDILDNAACGPDSAWLFEAQTDNEATLFGRSAVRARIEEAKKVCAECPVRGGCLFYGLDNGLTGVYGGELITQAMVDRLDKETSDRVRHADRRVDEGTGNAVVDEGQPTPIDRGRGAVVQDLVSPRRELPASA